MKVWIVITNEIDERFGMYISHIVDIFDSEEKAMECIKKQPPEAAPYFVSYNVK